MRAERGRRRAIDKPVTDFPIPNSPTSATVSPARTVRSIPFTGLISRPRTEKTVLQPVDFQQGRERGHRASDQPDAI